MGEFDKFKRTTNPYTIVGLAENPFNVSPLFERFRDKKLCIKDEKLFVLPEKLERELEILLSLKDRRVLPCGAYGVGKTTFLNFLMYLSFHYHKRFPTKIIITSENVEKASNELLFTLCIDIIDIIKQIAFTRPMNALRRLVVSLKHRDYLFDTLGRVIGSYEEEESRAKKRIGKIEAKFEPGGIGADYERLSENTLITSIKSFVESLPMKKIGEYLDSFALIVKELGYEEILITIDEADHLPNIDEFLSLVTRSRLIFFTSGYSFLVAGSPEIAHHTKVMGTVFDKTLFLEPCSREFLKEVFNKRINALNSSIRINNLFEKDTVDEIYSYSQGILKYAIRLAENSLDECITRREKKVTRRHIMDAIGKGQNEIKKMLSTTEMGVLSLLSEVGESSPSTKTLQNSSGMSRSSLYRILESLAEKGFVRRRKEGKKIYYAILPAYKNYFKK